MGIGLTCYFFGVPGKFLPASHLIWQYLDETDYMKLISALLPGVQRTLAVAKVIYAVIVIIHWHLIGSWIGGRTWEHVCVCATAAVVVFITCFDIFTIEHITELVTALTIYGDGDGEPASAHKHPLSTTSTRTNGDHSADVEYSVFLLHKIKIPFYKTIHEWAC